MNKNELIGAVAALSGLTKTDATKAVDGVFQAITQAMKQKEEVRLIGFGTFCVTERKETQGRNPRTGAPIKIPAARLPRFKAGKGLKDALAA